MNPKTRDAAAANAIRGRHLRVFFNFGVLREFVILAGEIFPDLLLSECRFWNG
jgi:hypothetical protein